jgi:hypothetical protein
LLGLLAASNQITSSVGRSTLLIVAESGSELLTRSQISVIGTRRSSNVMTGQFVTVAS